MDTYLKIDSSSQQAKSLIKYLKSLEFVKVIEEDELSLFEQIEQGLKEVKKIQDGEIEPVDFDSFLEELKESLEDE